MDGLLFTLIWVFGWVLLLILVWHLRARRRERWMEMVHKERMMAMEKGIPLPELPAFTEPSGRSTMGDVIGSVRVGPRWRLGLGALLVMLGAGVSLAFWLASPPDAHDAWPLGVVLVFFGIGLFLQHLVTRPAAR